MIWLKMLFIWIILSTFLNSVNADYVYLEPNGRRVLFLGDDLVITCFHSNFRGQINWLANGSLLDRSNFLARFVTYFNTPSSYNYSVIALNNIPLEVNETEIKCFEEEESMESRFSNSITILLQGKPEAVRSLQFEINDSGLNISWSPPFMLDSTLPIYYMLEILNTTSATSISVLISENFYILNSTPSSRMITCDDFNVTVRPMNKVGCGKTDTIVISSEEIVDVNVSTILRENSQKQDLLVRPSSYICSISNVTVKNINLNTTSKHIGKYSLYTNKQLNYLLSLQLEKRYSYEIEITVINNKGSIQRQFFISTHELAEVLTTEFDRHIQITLQFTNKNVERNGVFVMLLFCESPHCIHFNYNNSIFLSTYGEETVTYTEEYYSGNYIGYAFDARSNGHIIPSDGLQEVAYSIPSFFIQLQSGSVQEFIPSKSNCQYKHSDKNLKSSCISNTMGESEQQQVVQIKVDFIINQSLIISEPIPLNFSQCVEKNDETKYVISVPVNDNSNEYSTPLGSTTISTSGYSDKLNCENINTKGNKHIAIVVGVTIGAAFLISILITIIVIGLCRFRYYCYYCYRRYSKQINT